MALVDEIVERLAVVFGRRRRSGQPYSDRFERASRVEEFAHRHHDGRRREVHSVKGMGAPIRFPLITQMAAKFEDYIAHTGDRELAHRRDAGLCKPADVIEKRKRSGTRRGRNPAQTQALLPTSARWHRNPPGRAMVVTALTLGHARPGACQLRYQAQTVADPFEAMRLALTDKLDVILTSAMLDGLAEWI